MKAPFARRICGQREGGGTSEAAIGCLPSRDRERSATWTLAASSGSEEKGRGQAAPLDYPRGLHLSGATGTAGVQAPGRLTFFLKSPRFFPSTLQRKQTKSLKDSELVV